VDVSPNDLACLLGRSSSSIDNDDFRHYYWTSPVASAAPRLARDFERHVERLHDPADRPHLDPRGPSLWMGTSGSGTQCHYDVANNAILQLHGTKRVRVYPPGVGVERLHVYPDAHPRARKSQVDFDAAVGAIGGGGSSDDAARGRYPHYYREIDRDEDDDGDDASMPPTTTTTIPRPTMDVVLRPGDALYVPAFWFHHVENGHFPGGILRYDHDHDDDDGIVGYVDGPSVSMNSFALSGPMMTARRIFTSASRPLGAAAGGGSRRRGTTHVVALGTLGTKLVRELNVVDRGEEGDFIRKYLLEARYTPLALEDEDETTSQPARTKDPGDYDVRNQCTYD